MRSCCNDCQCPSRCELIAVELRVASWCFHACWILIFQDKHRCCCLIGVNLRLLNHHAPHPAGYTRCRDKGKARHKIAERVPEAWNRWVQFQAYPGNSCIYILIPAKTAHSKLPKQDQRRNHAACAAQVPYYYGISGTSFKV